MSFKSDIAVSVRGLSKAYTIAHNAGERHVTLAEQLLHRLKNPFQRRQTETFHALKDVSFDINKGDVVGIIGRNGAGKSTLLKILSRITEPTAGEIRLYGRVGSLLEVGTGFHPELTGRENIYLNGQILGMRRKEIDKQFDAIVDFAGVEKFLDTPVKRYSSGMYVRLAFAVAAHLESEILIVDEVLAVGDAEFQKKCLGKMKDVAGTGRTVLFVSHSMATVRQLCRSALLLARGSVTGHGAVDPVVFRYLANTPQNRFYSPRGVLRGVNVEQVGSELIIEAEFESSEALQVPGLGWVIHSIDGTPVCGTNPMRCGIHRTDSPMHTGRVTARVSRPALLDGQYSLSVWFGDGKHDLVSYPHCLVFEVAGMHRFRTGRLADDGAVIPECAWSFEPIGDRVISD